jgi:protocatechuate 3,4-dioxygenase beta subunit
MVRKPSRRETVAALIAAGTAGLVLRGRAEAQPTPACADADEPTPPQTEGPFFKPRSPRRNDLVEPNTRAPVMIVEGLVLTRSCRPVANALLDLWHADEKGDYDNSGYRYRGHILSDASGRYRFRTIVPALYPGRTRHFHLRVQAPRQGILTTQLYFPGEHLNDRDSIFDPALLMRMSESPSGRSGAFDFVLDLA